MLCQVSQVRIIYTPEYQINWCLALNIDSSTYQVYDYLVQGDVVQQIPTSYFDVEWESAQYEHQHHIIPAYV